MSKYDEIVASNEWAATVGDELVGELIDAWFSSPQKRHAPEAERTELRARMRAVLATFYGQIDSAESLPDERVLNVAQAWAGHAARQGLIRAGWPGLAGVLDELCEGLTDE